MAGYCRLRSQSVNLLCHCRKKYISMDQIKNSVFLLYLPSAKLSLSYDVHIQDKDINIHTLNYKKETSCTAVTTYSFPMFSLIPNPLIAKLGNLLTLNASENCSRTKSSTSLTPEQ
ncbi:hypothetical protein AVEN_129860-1 [Araneus ventricosus]|uniref:Uncharacterized protein n=1 Tax=Araneus ventricosus TaxID=182803 RepID=A0A4Y2JFQ2_ARAVE|nr:hypothetical protein AVEN_129860-1 [Araneus ventricosus]